HLIREQPTRVRFRYAAGARRRRDVRSKKAPPRSAAAEAHCPPFSSGTAVGLAGGKWGCPFLSFAFLATFFWSSLDFLPASFWSSLDFLPSLRSLNDCSLVSVLLAGAANTVGARSSAAQNRPAVSGWRIECAVMTSCPPK